MTAEDLAQVIGHDLETRLREAVKDMESFCVKRGEPLSKAQRFAVCSLPLRIMLGLEEDLASMIATYNAIRAVMPSLPEWPDEDPLLREYLRPAERQH